MPLDPSIPLSFRAPEVASPISNIGQLMQMRGLASEVALRNAQTEQAQANTGDIQAQALGRQRDLADQQTLQQAMGDADHPEFKAAAAKGDFSFLDGKVQPSSQLKFATAQLGKIKEQAGVDSTRLDNNTKYHNELGKTIFGLSQLPEADRGAAAASALAEIAKLPGARQLPDLSTLDLSDSGLKRYAADNNAMTEYWNAVTAQKEADQKIATSKAQGAASSATARKETADADKQEMLNTMLRNAKQGIQAGQHPIDSILPASVDAAANNSWKAAYNSALAAGGPEAAKSILEAAARHAQDLSPATRANKADTARAEAAATEGIHIDQAIRTETGKVQAMGSIQLAPAQQAIADKMATGDFNPALLARRPDGGAIIAAAIAKNPNWTQQTFATKKAFEDPQSKQSQNLGTISRIVGHIDRFEQNSKALGVSPSLLLGVNLTGKAAATQEDAHAISAELEKLVSGGVGTEGQTQSWAKSLTSTSPAIRQQAVDEISQLIGSQYEGMNQTYKTTVGSDLPIEKYVSSNARAWMTAKGINAGGGGHSAPAADPALKAYADKYFGGDVQKALQYSQSKGK